MENTLALASVSARRTRAGSVIIVRIVTPFEVMFRTYPRELGRDAALAEALESCGVPRAYVWAALPLPGRWSDNQDTTSATDPNGK